jgi:sulfur transfer protein SufE
MKIRTLFSFLVAVALSDSFLLPVYSRRRLMVKSKPCSIKSSLINKLHEVSDQLSSINSPFQRLEKLVSIGDHYFSHTHNTRDMELTKVDGCVSVVKIGLVICKEANYFLGDNIDRSDSMNNDQEEISPDQEKWTIKDIYGESDARVTRGIVALLCSSLNGSDVKEVLSLQGADIARRSKLDQVLPEGRISGINLILNTIFKLIEQELLKQKLSELYFQSGGVDTCNSPPKIATTPIQASKLSALISTSDSLKEAAVLLSGGVDSSVALQLAIEVSYCSCP